MTLSAVFFQATLIGLIALGGDSYNFEDVEVGTLPPGWASAKTGEGQGSVWKVTEDKSSPAGSKVLTQTSPDGPNPLFNLCVADKTRHTDLDLTVAYKAVAGEYDQGGGPVWRYQDANNYYVCRMNPLEDNYRLYKVVKGKRMRLASKRIDAKAGMWHTIRVVHKGTRIRCSLNGTLLLDVEDDTFKGAGKVGLWTKADAVTSFDGLKVDTPE